MHFYGLTVPFPRTAIMYFNLTLNKGLILREAEKKVIFLMASLIAPQALPLEKELFFGFPYLVYDFNYVSPQPYLLTYHYCYRTITAIVLNCYQYTNT